MGAILGIIVGRMLAPKWIYIDNYQILETGQELLQYRSFHAAIVLGITVSFFTLVAARLVGLGVSSTIVVSTFSILVFNVLQRVRTANMVDASMIIGEIKFVPIFVFSAFSVVGIWYFIKSLRGSERERGDT